MALSDCPKCWDTPCSCGHMGYTLVYHNDDRATLKQKIHDLENEVCRLKQEIEKTKEA